MPAGNPLVRFFFSRDSRLCQPTITVCRSTDYPWRESQLPFFHLLPFSLALSAC